MQSSDGYDYGAARAQLERLSAWRAAGVITEVEYQGIFKVHHLERVANQMSYADQWNPAHQSALRDNISGPADGAPHQYFQTTQEDKFRNRLFTCNCQNPVTDEERYLRQHCLEQALDAQYGGLVKITANGFERIEPKEPELTDAQKLLALLEKLTGGSPVNEIEG